MMQNKILKTGRPTLLLDEFRCRNNIRKMASKARDNKLVFRPHFKTHQSATIGEWFREEGIEKITVSSVTMADYFAKAGWWDILIAFPVNLWEIDPINKLNSGIHLSLTAESLESAEFLDRNLQNEVNIYLKIDTGHHRTGIAWDNNGKIKGLISLIRSSSRLRFKGFLAHSGHTYQAKNREEIILIYKDTLNKLLSLKAQFSFDDFSPVISVGDTPSCSIVSDFGAADEIRPGNFVFYDVMQFHLGACTIDDIAVAMVCPIVAKHPERNELIIYGGAIHFSKEFIENDQGIRNYGLITKITGNGWSEPVSGSCLKALYQEHGTIKSNPQFLSEINTGDMVGILPVHSCLTAHQMKEYITTDGKILTKMD